MATFLDVSILGYFQPLFIFLLIFVVGYGFLQKTNLFGEGNKTVNLVAALCIAAITTFVGEVSGIIGLILPWMILVLVLLFLIFAIYGFFGIKKEQVWGMLGNTTVLVILLLIVFVVLAITFEGMLTPYEEVQPPTTIEGEAVENVTVGAKTPTTETIKMLTHPKILGALFLLFITAAAAKLIVDRIG